MHSLTASKSAMLERIKLEDRGKKVKDKSRSISRSSSPNAQYAKIAMDTRLQASNDPVLIHQTDQASGTTTPNTPTTPGPSNQSQSTKPDQTNLTQADPTDPQQPIASVRDFWSLESWHKIDHHLQPVTIQ
jgi:hypothetical protein